MRKTLSPKVRHRASLVYIFLKLRKRKPPTSCPLALPLHLLPPPLLTPLPLPHPLPPLPLPPLPLLPPLHPLLPLPPLHPAPLAAASCSSSLPFCHCQITEMMKLLAAVARVLCPLQLPQRAYFSPTVMEVTPSINSYQDSNCQEEEEPSTLQALLDIGPMLEMP